MSTRPSDDARSQLEQVADALCQAWTVIAALAAGPEARWRASPPLRRGSSSLSSLENQSFKGPMADREEFEPPIPLRVCRISSAVHSTSLPPVRGRSGRSGLVTTQRVPFAQAFPAR